MSRLAFLVVVLIAPTAQAQLIVTKRSYDRNGNITRAEIAEVDGNVVSDQTVLGGEKLIQGLDPTAEPHIFDLLVRESVRRELQMSKEQTRALHRLLLKMREERASLAVEFAGDRNHQFACRKRLLQMQHEIKIEALSEILVPEQLQRLNEIAWRVELAQVGIEEALVSGHLGTEIGVSIQEYEKIHRVVTEAMADAREKIDRIRDEAEQKVLASLAPEKREHAKKLLGEYFFYELPLSRELSKLEFLEATEEDLE